MKLLTEAIPLVRGSERLRRSLRHYLTATQQALQAQTAALTSVCLGGALVAQSLLDRKILLGLAALLFALVALLFVLLYRQEKLEDEADVAAQTAVVSEAQRSARWSLVLAASLLGVLAFPRFSGNRFAPDGTLLWALGLVLLGVAAWSPWQRSAGEPGARRWNAQGLMLSWTSLALLGIMLVGAFYRLYRLNQIPAEMGCDLPHNYNNIRLILRREFLIYFPSYPGREGLFFYLAAPLCRLFGLSHFTIKLSSALVGILTLPIFYLLGKALFNREVGLYAAGFLSISHWHIILTRVGYRASLVPLLVALVWYFLVRGLRTGRPWFWALSGLCLGLGMYSYTAFWVVPLLVGLSLLTLTVTGRGRVLWANRQNVLLLALVALFVLIPLARYVYEQPDAYSYRAATRLTSLERPLPQDVLATLLGNTARALLMFNYRGDMAFIANVPYLRELGLLTAALFVLGLGYLLWRWQQRENATVLIALGVMLLPTILALAFPHEVPNAIRAIGVLPAAMLLPAVALALVRKRLAALLPSRPPRELKLALSLGGERTWQARVAWRWSGRQFWLALGVLALLLEARAAYPTYFHDYVARLPGQNYAISLALAQTIDAFVDGEAYIKVVPYWYDGNAVRAQLRRADENWHNELDTLAPDQPPLVGEPGKFLVIVHPDDVATLNTLQQAFPRGIALKHLDQQGKPAFVTFYGER